MGQALAGAWAPAAFQDFLDNMKALHSGCDPTVDSEGKKKPDNGEPGAEPLLSPLCSLVISKHQHAARTINSNAGRKESLTDCGRSAIRFRANLQKESEQQQQEQRQHQYRVVK